MRFALLAVLLLLPVSTLSAAAGEKLDMRFNHEGRVFHKLAEIDEGTDLDLSIPLQSEDKSSSVLLKLRASLQPVDAFGRGTLLYKMSLHGAGDALLLESAATVYVRHGTYSKIAECGGWDFNLGLNTKDKSGLRTNDDMVTVTAKSARGDQKCQMHIKPGANGKMAAQLYDDEGKPQVFSFKLSPGDEQQFGGTFNVGYELKFPGYATQGVVALAPRHGQTIKQGSRAAYVWLSQDN